MNFRAHSPLRHTHSGALALLALLAAGSVAQASGASRPLVYAVVVGHNDGWGVLPTLRYADDDALRFYRLALQLAPRENVALLTELDVDTWRRLQLEGTPPPPYLPPTRQRLLQVIALYKKQIARARVADPKRPVHLLFFFSGHGERGYFLLKRPGQARRGGAFTGEDLRHAFADSKATLNGLFIDACKSQSLFVAKGAGDDELGPDFSGLISQVERAADKLPIGVLTSTVSDRPAGEADDIRGGYFSHVLTSGLSGAADADSDGIVRYDELAAFVAFHTRRISGQQPWFHPPNGRMKAALVDLRARPNRIEIPPGIGGHFAVFDGGGRALLLEAHKTEAQWTRLILPGGSYKAVWLRSSTQGLLARAELSGKPVRLMRGAFATPIELGVLPVPKGEGLGAPTSAPSTDAALAAFHADRSGFDQPFTPRVVSTLAVAYSSGLSAKTPPFAVRQRSRRSGARPHLLTAGYALLGAPVTPRAVAHGASVAYAYRPLSWLRVGARLAFARSEHTTEAEGFSFGLYRLMLQAEGAYVLPLGRWFELSAGGYFGWQLVMVTRQSLVQCGPLNEDQCTGTTLYGDASSVRGGLLAGARVTLGAGLSLGLRAGYGFELVRQERGGGGTGADVFFGPQLLAGVGYAF